jgi:hypothetical protein
MKKTIGRLAFAFFLTGLPLFAQSEHYQLYFDRAVPQVKFGAEEIKAELAKQKAVSSSDSVAAFRVGGGAVSIVIASAKADVARLCQELHVSVPHFKKSQAYSIRKKQTGNNTTVAVLAGDDNGAMYGALDVAEAIKLGTLASLKNSDQEPFVENRGIKFNIALDMRSRTYSDGNDSNQKNIPEMWSLDFWKEMLDEMARTRYNVISLWSLDPFPSLVKVPEFPDVALNDVWRKTAASTKDAARKNSDHDPVDSNGGHEVVKKISMDGKIQFWRDVMQYAHDRGITVYLITWNIFTEGAGGKHGINDDQNNATTIAYLRASVREAVLAYPLLAGIGVTAGEHMQNLKGEYTNEKWLWKTYGEGVRDALKIQPDRKFRMIHRFHMASQSEILDAWKDYPSDFDFSFKYLYAHMYSDTKSVFILPALEMLAPKMKMWLELRNDDIYSFRWGNPDFAREFVRNLPPENKFEGFFMGPDGYCWGREFLSTEPETPRELVMKKQWYSFMLWGRLSFDPNLPNSLFQETLAARFPEVSAAKLYQASCEASKIFPELTRFFWGDIDVRWFPEACVKHGTFYTIQDFIMQVTMPGTDNINIKLWRDQKLKGEKMDGKTPLQVAGSLQEYSRNALKLVAELRQIPSNNKELRLTLGDCESFAHLGNYYAEKILGAADIALYDATKNPAEQASAVKHLEAALDHWKRYSASYTKQYVQPVLYGRAGLVDIPGKLMTAVAADITMAKNWQPGTIKGPLVGRKEMNFKP